MRKTKKKILFVGSEAQPFIASGGLGDVLGSLPKALASLKEYDVRVVLPLYSSINEVYRKKFKYIGNTYVRLSWRSQYLGLFEYKEKNVTYYFLDNEYYFNRPSLYGYYDEAERFAFFSKGALEILPMINFIPQIIHCHDWQSALIPILVKTNYKDVDLYKNIRTVFTIHNMEYQGRFGKEILYDIFELPEYAFSLVENDGDINLMKGAIQCADIVSTVSPTYAKEILTDSASCGLKGIITANEYKLKGILNGIDTFFYNPSTDKKTFELYDENNLVNKKINKKRLQESLSLPVVDVPMIAMITRLVGHKGIDLICDVFEKLMEKDVQFVILGTGEEKYEDFFRSMERRYPNKVKALIEYNGTTSRRLYAGSDIFLMPSKNEPCGLSQMIASRYGSIPIVRRVGGLNDSIIDVGDNGFGYTFVDYNVNAMENSISRAVNDYNDKDKWNSIIIRAMTEDFSWDKSAVKYSNMYKELL